MGVSETDEVAVNGERAEPAGPSWSDPVEPVKVRRYGRLKWAAAAAACVGALALGNLVAPGHLVGERPSANFGPEPSQEMVLADYEAAVAVVRVGGELAQDDPDVEDLGDCAAAFGGSDSVSRQQMLDISAALVDRGWHITDIRDKPIEHAEMRKGTWHLVVFTKEPDGQYFTLYAIRGTSSCEAKARKQEAVRRQAG